MVGSPTSRSAPTTLCLQLPVANDTTARVWNLERRTSRSRSSPQHQQRRRVGHVQPGRALRRDHRSRRQGLHPFGTERGFDAGIARSTSDGPVNASAFSPDGELVATASDDGSARLWDATVDPNGPLPRADARRIGGHVLPAPVRRGPFVAFSPDGRRILSAGADGTARLWGPGDGLVSLQHGGPVNTGFFSRDGKTVITASDDGSARLWSVAGAARSRSWNTALL